MMNNENGRSMVEMLGVLAIIGVLSVAGIAGYTMAMNRYRANEIANTAALLVITAQTNNSLTASTGSGVNQIKAPSFFDTDASMDANCTSGNACTVTVKGYNGDALSIAEEMVSESGAGFTIVSG